MGLLLPLRRLVASRVLEVGVWIAAAILVVVGLLEVLGFLLGPGPGGCRGVGPDGCRDAGPSSR